MAEVGFTPEGPVPEEWEHFLPPDAPAGHRAHTIVNYVEKFGKSPTYWFKYGGRVGFTFQTTLGLMEGNKPAAGRLARACYVMLDNGKDKDEVTEVRKAVYAQIKESTKPKAKPKEQLASKEQAAPPPNGGNGVQPPADAPTKEKPENGKKESVEPAAEAKEKKAEGEASQASPRAFPPQAATVATGRGPPPPEGAPGLELLDEVPADSAAFSHIRWDRDLYWFNVGEKGNKIRMQCTVKAAKGWRELAYRIVALCYVMLEKDPAGASKELALEHRTELLELISDVPAYDEVGAPPPVTEKAKKRKKGDDADEKKPKKDKKVDKKAKRKEKKRKKKAAKEAAAKQEAAKESQGKKRRQVNGEGSSSSSASHSSSSSSADSDDDDEQQLPQAPAKGGTAPPRKPWPPKMPPVKAVAKMLVRSGLRKSSNFSYAWD